MPSLKNQKWERFAQELAKGKTADEAYQEAGYQGNRGNAARLKANESILKRVAEIQERGAVRAEVTVASILDELEEARQTAIANGQTAAAVSASMGKAKLKGLIVEKRENGSPGDFTRMNDDELDDFIAERERTLRGGSSREDGSRGKATLREKSGRFH